MPNVRNRKFSFEADCRVNREFSDLGALPIDQLGFLHRVWMSASIFNNLSRLMTSGSCQGTFKTQPRGCLLRDSYFSPRHPFLFLGSGIPTQWSESLSDEHRLENLQDLFCISCLYNGVQFEYDKFKSLKPIAYSLIWYLLMKP